MAIWSCSNPTSARSIPASAFSRRCDAEEAALAADPRIVNSEGAPSAPTPASAFLPIRCGFAGDYRTSSCSLSTMPVAREGESMERDYWYSSARSFARLGEGRRHRPQGRPTRAAPLGLAQSRHAKGPGDFRFADRAQSAGQRLRSRRRRFRSIAMLRFWRANWARKSPPNTSPSSTMALCRASSALRLSTTKACPRAAPW